MSGTQDSDIGRGDQIRFGPFEFRVPDSDCQVVDCDKKADGVVRYGGGDKSVTCCVDCAPGFLEVKGAEWTPLAGGRPLDTADDPAREVEP